LPNDSSGSNGLPTILAALILGLSLAGGAYMVSGSLDRTTERLSAVLTAITEMKVAQAPAPAPSRAPSRPGRPDPSKVYKVAVGEAPTKGPKTAEISVVEWSDFQ